MRHYEGNIIQNGVLSMKCRKCGAECQDNQVFCNRCGAPIQVVPDFNLLEAELANSIGELMDEDQAAKENVQYRVDLSDDDYLSDYPSDHSGNTKEYDTFHANGMNTQNNRSNIQNDRSNTQNNRSKTQAGPNVTTKQNANSVKRKQAALQDSDYEVNGIGVEGQSKKNKKKFEQEEDRRRARTMLQIKIGIFSVIVIIIVILTLAVLKKENASDKSGVKFSDVYSDAFGLYTSKDYEGALNKFLEAKSCADDKNERIKVNKSLISTYESLKNHDKELIEVLKEQIELEPKETSNYQKLAEIYDRNSMTEELDAFISSITDVTIQSALSEYNTPTPQFSQEEGTYDYVSLKLTVSGDGKIYYTTDGTEPTTSSELYSQEILLNQEGTVTVKAFAVNEKGVSSRVITKVYEIKSSRFVAPEITPAAGSYTEDGKITITVPQGMKCYYVYGKDAVVPTTADTEYTEPIDMLRGRYVLSAVLVKADGTISEVAQNIYILDVARNISYSEAEEKLILKLAEAGTILKSGEFDYVKYNGSKVRFVYDSIAAISNKEYFVIKFEELTGVDTVVSTEYFGVDTVSGEIVELTTDSLTGSYVIKNQQ